MDREEWLRRYKARLIERGVDEPFAQECAENEGDHYDSAGLDGSPEESADEELSYWASDG